MNCINYNILVFRNKIRKRISFNKVVCYSKVPKYYLTDEIKNRCWWNSQDYENFVNYCSIVFKNKKTKKVTFNNRVTYSKVPNYFLTPKMKIRCWWKITDYDIFCNYAILNYIAKNKISPTNKYD